MERKDKKEFATTSTHKRALCYLASRSNLDCAPVTGSDIFHWGNVERLNGILKYSATLSQEHFHACILLIYKLFKKNIYFQMENIKST